MTTLTTLTLTVTYESELLRPEYAKQLVQANTAQLLSFLQENEMLCCPPMQHGLLVVDIGSTVEQKDKTRDD